MKKIKQLMTVVVALIGTTALGETNSGAGSALPASGSGEYFLYNVGQQKFLTAGASWGTDACLDDHGIPLTVTYISEGKYTIGTLVGGGYIHLDGGRLNAANGTSVQWRIEKVENGEAYTLKYDETEYTIASDCIYLVVRGKDLNIGSGCSYLWWLNGVNHGTQVSPYANKAITVEGCEQQIVAWDMQQSGLYANFSGERPSVCMGKTIFGLTSSDGETDIYDINFVSDVEKYIEDCIKDTPNGISYRLKEKFCSTSYDLKGHKLQHLPQQGIYIHDGKKKLANQ